jgi:hypothetical protein
MVRKSLLMAESFVAFVVALWLLVQTDVLVVN